MKRLLMIEIDAGETTCASEPGKFCPWFRTRVFGQIPVCGLFGMDLETSEPDGRGWTIRARDCQDLETPAVPA